MTIRQAKAGIDAQEFAAWQTYYGLDPFGLERFDYQAGIIAATMANAWRGKGQKAMTPGDFMPQFGPGTPAGPKSADEVAHKLDLFLRQHNAALRQERGGN